MRYDDGMETITHHLVLPADSNHYGTLYAGALLRLSLEAGYATAFNRLGGEANLVLRRVLDLQCRRPVPVGKVVEIRGTPLLVRRTFLIVGLAGRLCGEPQTAWMDGLMSFVQVGEGGRPVALPREVVENAAADWSGLRDRAERLVHLR